MISVVCKTATALSEQSARFTRVAVVCDSFSERGALTNEQNDHLFGCTCGAVAIDVKRRALCSFAREICAAPQTLRGLAFLARCDYELGDDTLVFVVSLS